MSEHKEREALRRHWAAAHEWRRKNRYKVLEVYAPRCPMTQLPDELRITKTYPSPPHVHYGLPIPNGAPLRAYAERNNKDPGLYGATICLSDEVEYNLLLSEPYAATAQCRFVIELYSNYTMERKKLVDEDEEDVISMVKDLLDLDRSLRPQWYYHRYDPWRPSLDRLQAWLDEDRNTEYFL